MNEINETLGPRRLGGEVLAQVARERRDGELTWSDGGQPRKLLFKAGRPELVIDRDGRESATRAHVIAVVRALATATVGQCRLVPLSRPLQAALNLDTLGETLVALVRDLQPAQLEAVWTARRGERVDIGPGFEKLAAVVAKVGGVAVAKPVAGLSVAALVAGAPLPAQRAWLALIALGVMTTRAGEATEGIPAKERPVPMAGPVATDSAGAAVPPAVPSSESAPTRPNEGRGESGPHQALVLPDEFEARGLALDIEKVFRQLPNLDHYQVLGLEPKATADEVRAAYFSEAMKWHNDRLSGKGLPEEFIHKAEEIFRRVGEAQEVLSNPDERKTFDFIRERQAKGLPTDVNVILEAEGLFRTGQTLMRRGDAVAAEPILRRAVEANKGEAEFWVHFGFAVHGAKGKEGLTEARQAIRKGLEMNGKLDAAHEFLGRIAHIEGQLDEAKRELTRALELNPKNTNAQRELRLINMRAGKGKESAGGKGLSGLLGGLLKK